ncbi:MAG TPA: cytochrome c peroxidase [Kiloniellales bacterium]
MVWRHLAIPLAVAVVCGMVPALAAAHDPAAGIEAVTDEDYRGDALREPAEVALGRLLFFDKILSGNRNIACANCHQFGAATADGIALALGEGAIGARSERHVVAASPVIDHEARNTPALFNLGAREFTRLFFDGRVAEDPDRYWPSGFRSPAAHVLPSGLDNVLAAQAMLPVVDEIEMAGHEGENPVADAAAAMAFSRFTKVWELLAARLRDIPEYVALFQAAFPEIAAPADITFVHAANAIAAFEASAFRADGSPFDAYLRTRDPAVLPPAAYRGMELFYGEAGCAACHTGKFLTDLDFHAIAMPQIGPGRRHGIDQGYWLETGFPERLEDWGRYEFTRKLRDKLRFRTPSLRNVALTGPWGHAGAYDSLKAVVRHHLDPQAGLASYDAESAPLVPINYAVERLSLRTVPPERLDDYQRRAYWVLQSPGLRNAIAAANELTPRALDDGEVADLVAFLESLTDPASQELDRLVPDRVPSGLPVDR